MQKNLNEAGLSSRTKDHICFFMFFLIANLLLLLNRGVYWDDWVMYHVDPKYRLLVYEQSGRPLFGHFFNLAFWGSEEVSLIKTVSFFAYCLPMFLLNQILSEVKSLPRIVRIPLILVFGLFPVVNSKMSFTIAQYGISTLLFFVAFWLVKVFFQERKIIYRFAALGLFYISFNMDSLLVYYALVLIFIYWKSYEKEEGYFGILNFIRKYLDFIILPIFFYWIKTNFFKPYGLYSNYNRVTLSGILAAPKITLVSIKASFVDTLVQLMKTSYHSPILTIILTAIFFSVLKLYFAKEVIFQTRLTKRQCAYFLVAGIAILFLGLFPYAVVGAIATNLCWESRHQSLMHLGTAIIIVSILEFLMAFCQNRAYFFSKLRWVSGFNPNHARVFYYSIFLATATIYQTKRNLAFELDSYKQESIVFNLKKNQVIRDKSDFIFLDNASHLNFDQRTFNFYEYTGLMKLAYGDASRIVGTSIQDIASTKGAKEYQQYNFHEYAQKIGTYMVRIESNYRTPSDWDIILLLFSRLFDRIHFQQSIETLVHLEVDGPI